MKLLLYRLAAGVLAAAMLLFAFFLASVFLALLAVAGLAVWAWVAWHGRNLPRQPRGTAQGEVIEGEFRVDVEGVPRGNEVAPRRDDRQA